MPPTFTGACLAFGIACCASAQSELSPRFVDSLVDAIWRVEGGSATSYPYGIKCHKHTKEQARKICINTIHNTHARWIKSGKKGEFVLFLADRYCPPSTDFLGNLRWKKNITNLMKGIK